MQLRNVQHDQEHHNPGRASRLEASSAEGSSGGTLLKNFVALHPPEFRGGAGAVEAENWLLEMEKHMRPMDCTEGQEGAVRNLSPEG